MTKLVQAKCPECGARLKVDPQAAEAKCEYCGSVSPIQVGKKRVVRANPQAPPPAPAIYVPSQRSTWMIYLMSFGLPLLIGGIVLINALRTSGQLSGDGLSGTLSSLAGEKLQWVGYSQPMLLDLNGDQIADPIGRVRLFNLSSSDHTEHVAAFDAVSGKQLWRTEQISDISQSSDSRVALVGNTLLIADPLGMLRGYLPATGQKTWQAVIGERVARMCGAGQGFARVETKDKRALTIALTTGKLTPAGKADPKSPCVGAWSTEKDGSTMGTQKLQRFPFGREPMPKVNGLYADYVLKDTGSGTTVAVGYRTPGTQIPTAAAYTAIKDDGKKGRRGATHSRNISATVHWVTNIPAVNPLTVDEGTPKTGTLGMGRVLFAYEMKNSDAGWRVTCLDAATGRNLWDVAVPKSDTGDVSSIVVSNRQVFVSIWTWLHVFDLATGKFRMTIGTW